MVNGDISVSDDLDLDQMMFASFPVYSITISCQIFNVVKGDFSVCDDLDLNLDQMMFASFPEYSIIISCQIFSVENGDISVCNDLDLD